MPNVYPFRDEPIGTPLEFRSLKNPHQIIKVFKIPQTCANVICSSLDTLILKMQDGSVHWLNCETGKPVFSSAGPLKILKSLDDMCYSPDTKTLITSGSSEGFDMSDNLTAYSVSTGQTVLTQPKWKARAIGPNSVTTDGDNYVFTAGIEGVEMFSIVNGQNLGLLIPDDDEGFGDIGPVRWSPAGARSTLVLCHCGLNDITFKISTIELM